MVDFDAGQFLARNLFIFRCESSASSECVEMKNQSPIFVECGEKIPSLFISVVISTLPPQKRRLLALRMNKLSSTCPVICKLCVIAFLLFFFSFFHFCFVVVHWRTCRLCGLGRLLDWSTAPPPRRPTTRVSSSCPSCSERTRFFFLPVSFDGEGRRRKEDEERKVKRKRGRVSTALSSGFERRREGCWAPGFGGFGLKLAA